MMGSNDFLVADFAIYLLGVKQVCHSRQRTLNDFSLIATSTISTQYSLSSNLIWLIHTP